LLTTRLAGADDADRVPADFCVDAEEEARFFRERDEDEPVFIAWRVVAKVASLRSPGFDDLTA
jgi:hypothetical protein